MACVEAFDDDNDDDETNEMMNYEFLFSILQQ